MNILAVVVPYIVLLLVTWVRLGLRKVPIPSGGYNIDKHTGSTCCTGYEKDDRIPIIRQYLHHKNQLTCHSDPKPAAADAMLYNY